VLAFLSLVGRKDIYCFAIPNAGKRSPWRGKYMKAEGLTAGVADLCIMMPNGVVAWMELKTRKGRQSLEQRGFEEICKVLRHPYALVRNLDEAEAVLTQWGALR
jgi:hypothetical protein